MATKAKAPSAAALKKQVADLQSHVEKLTKELTHSESLKAIYSKNSTEYQAEISAVHDLLDVLPNTIGRKKEDGYSEHKLMTRLASFLANRG